MSRLPSRRRALTFDEAARVWDVLVSEAGASPKQEARKDFERYLTEEVPSGHEFRFCGLLGFGGKLYFDDVLGARVSCYIGDRTDERKAIIVKLNGLLAEIVPGRGALIQLEAEKAEAAFAWLMRSVPHYDSAMRAAGAALDTVEDVERTRTPSGITDEMVEAAAVVLAGAEIIVAAFKLQAGSSEGHTLVPSEADRCEVCGVSKQQALGKHEDLAVLVRRAAPFVNAVAAMADDKAPALGWIADAAGLVASSGTEGASS